jgi:DnaJ-domain-containing protein 1
MADWLDYQTVALVVIFALGFGIVWWVLNVRGGASAGAATPNEWHEILGVRPDAPFEEVSRAYQALLARCAADKTAKPERAAVEWAFSMARRRHGLS